jgi:AcrR family transcriptional regulator
MGRKERQQGARDATRRAILDAALELFVEHGYPQVSIRNIAQKVDYSPGAIYGYFESKDDIFYALAEEGFRLLGGTDVAGDDRAASVEDLKAAAWRFYQFSKEHPEYFALVFLDRHVPRISREYERFPFIHEMKARMCAKIQACLAAGVLPASKLAPQAIIRLLFAPVLGIAAMRLSERLAPGEDPDALVRAAIDATVSGLRAGTQVS